MGQYPDPSKHLNVFQWFKEKTLSRLSGKVISLAYFSQSMADNTSTTLPKDDGFTALVEINCFL